MSKLNEIRKKKLLEELKTRTAPKWNLQDQLFDKQLAFVNDTAKYKAAVCSRRAGKSLSCAYDVYQTANDNPGSTVLYITLTRQNAKALVWRELVKLNNEYKLNITFNNTDLTATLANGSMIYFSGAAHEDEIEKFRGYSLKKVYLDEVQSFKPWIETLIDDVLSPATWDTNGQIILIGTPGLMPSGYFYDVTAGKKAHGWSNHHWTIHDNPYILLKTGRTPEEILAEDRKLKGLTENSPKFLREGLGKWVQDTDSLVYRYNENVNHFVEAPAFNEMTYIMGIDLGYDDNDSISMIGFHKTKKKAYLVQEYLKPKQDITDLIVQIKRFKDIYSPQKMVIDAGALGKKITEEIVRRHGINLEAAEKSRKFEFIELLNDDLRSGRFMVRKDSHAANDYSKVEWDVLQKDRRKISDKYHGDASDSVLYAWRAGYHYLSKDKALVDNSPEARIEMFWEKEAQKLERSNNFEWWDED